MKRLIPILLAILLPISAHAASILVWGDSLSAAYGMPQNEAWPALLEQKLRSGGIPYQVINASLSGETTARGLARLPAALAQYKPDIIVIELGAVDALHELPRKTTQDNLARMIKMAQKANAKVLLVAASLPDNFCPNKQKQFQEIFRGAADEYKTGFTLLLPEASAHQADLLQQDAIHPNAKAQPLILSSIWPALKPLIE